MAELSDRQKEVLLNKATEAPFSGKLLHNDMDGAYSCGQCGVVLFDSGTKFDSGSGWPSFFDAVNPGAIKEIQDSSHGMTRTEVVCAACGGHLGHLFEDGPQDKTGMRYCINSCSLNFTTHDKSQSIRGDGEV